MRRRDSYLAQRLRRIDLLSVIKLNFVELWLYVREI